MCCEFSKELLTCIDMFVTGCGRKANRSASVNVVHDPHVTLSNVHEPRT